MFIFRFMCMLQDARAAQRLPERTNPEAAAVASLDPEHQMILRHVFWDYPSRSGPVPGHLLGFYVTDDTMLRYECCHKLSSLASSRRWAKVMSLLLDPWPKEGG